jgi:hypothetical protein
VTALWQLAAVVAICLVVFGVFVKWESHLEHHPRGGKYRRQP